MISWAKLKRILLSLLVIGVVGSSAVGLSRAYFSDTETSKSNNFTAGRLDLKINTLDNPPAIINLTDLKPGDDRNQDNTLYIDFNPANVFMHIKNLDLAKPTQTDNKIQDFITYDLSIADSPIITNDNGIKFSDAVSCWIPLGKIVGATNTKLSQSFHFDSNVDNWAQGQQLKFTEEFYAQQVNDPNPPPSTGTGRVWDPEAKKCKNTLAGSYHLMFTCTANCSGIFPHTMSIISFDFGAGNFSGSGTYDPDNSYKWNINGNVVGSNIIFHILYTGVNPGYTVDGNGTFPGDGSFNGTATSSSSQSFTFNATKI